MIDFSINKNFDKMSNGQKLVLQFDFGVKNFYFNIITVNSNERTLVTVQSTKIVFVYKHIQYSKFIKIINHIKCHH